MTNNTKWVIGTGVAVITAIVASAVAVIAVVVTTAGDIRADLRDIRTDLLAMNARMDGKTPSRAPSYTERHTAK